MPLIIEHIWEKSLLGAHLFLFLFCFCGGIAYLARAGSSISAGVGLFIAIILTTVFQIVLHFVPFVKFQKLSPSPPAEPEIIHTTLREPPDPPSNEDVHISIDPTSNVIA